MLLVIGLAVLSLTVYFATLASAIRTYSHSRLEDLLPPDTAELTLTWLSRNESALTLVTGLARTAAKLALLVVTVSWWVGLERDNLRLSELVPPAGIAVVLTIVFGVGMPHVLALHRAERILARSLGLLRVLVRLFWPVGQLLAGMETLVLGLLGRARESPEDATERAEQEILDAVSEGELQGAVNEEQKEIIESVFKLDETPVGAIMTPRARINAIPVEATYEETRRAVIEFGHSRIPVYEESLDHIVGVLYTKDLWRAQPGPEFSLRKLMRRAPYVPRSKSIAELLHELQASRVHIAIVLDEYGATAGLATLEDVLEELVGEIDDEYDLPGEAESDFAQIDPETTEMDGRARIEEVNDRLGLALPLAPGYDTIGGFVLHQLGHMPGSGDEFEFEGLRIRVVGADQRRIQRVQIQTLRAAEAAGGR